MSKLVSVSSLVAAETAFIDLTSYLSKDVSLLGLLDMSRVQRRFLCCASTLGGSMSDSQKLLRLSKTSGRNRYLESLLSGGLRPPEGQLDANSRVSIAA